MLRDMERGEKGDKRREPMDAEARRVDTLMACEVLRGKIFDLCDKPIDAKGLDQLASVLWRVKETEEAFYETDADRQEAALGEIITAWKDKLGGGEA